MGFKISFGGTREKVAESMARSLSTHRRRGGAGMGEQGWRRGHSGSPGGRWSAGSPAVSPWAAGTGSQEHSLLSMACQPRGCACDGSGGRLGPQYALLVGKKFCRERLGEPS